MLNFAVRAGCYRAALLAGAAALLLQGCVGGLRHANPPSEGVPPVPFEQRLVQLRALTQFDLRGRIGASDGQNGFSAGLRWRQRGEQSTLDLSGPLGTSAAHVDLTDQGLRVTASDGAQLNDEAARSALSDTLGFEPPLHSLRYWVLGASDPALTSQMALDDQQRLLHLEQDGWSIQYGQYVRVQQQWLPRQLTVTRDAWRLRLVVNQWQLAP